MKTKLKGTVIIIITALVVYFLVSTYLFPNWDEIKKFVF